MFVHLDKLDKSINPTVVEIGHCERQSWISWIVAIITMLLITGLFYWMALGVVICLYFIIVHGSLIATSLLVILALSTVYPSQILWQGFIDSWIWKTWCEYHSFTIIREGELDRDKKYIFAEFPHGVFPLGFMLSATIVQKMLSQLRVEGAIASVLFRIPLLRQICHWFGARPATHRNMNKVLGSGHSVGLMAGGIAEIFLANRHTEKIYLKKRKGFVKLALQHGAALVPVYYFGNSQLFDFSANRFLSKVSRQFRMSLLVYFGRWYLPIPYQHPITMVIGPPVEVPHIEHPTEAQVEEYHAKFVEAITVLYDRYSPVVGWHDKPLVVV